MVREGVLPAEDLPGQVWSQAVVTGSGPSVPFLSHHHQVLEQPCSGAYIRLWDPTQEGRENGLRETYRPVYVCMTYIHTYQFNSVTKLNVQIADF